MENHGLEQLEKPGGSGSVVPYIIIALLILVIIILLFVFFLSPDSLNGLRSSIGSSSSSQTTVGITDSDGGSTNAGSIELGQTEPSDPSGSPENPSSGALTRSGTGSQALAPGSDQNSTQGSGDGECSVLADNIESFFNSLDTRDYIKEFQLDSPSATYFPKLIQKLVDNPPIVSGETDDLFTILQNTAHFFRILGKKNILVLKGILDREQATFEQTLADFYELTAEPDCLEKRFDLSIGQDPLYAYAGFFLNTMGGRLYLFRRDSMSRMVVNFYAILIIEQANREGRNKYGIDIKDSIDSLIIEIESSRIKLQMRDYYLDTLYDLKVKYQ